jgi:hypothetical protein
MLRTYYVLGAAAAEKEQGFTALENKVISVQVRRKLTVR